MNSSNFNLASIEKFDEALNHVNSLSSCNISNAMSILNEGGLSSTYAGITSGIVDIKNSINRLSDGTGPEGLIDNYKSGYASIKNAIIEAYIAEYEFAIENGDIMGNTTSLKSLSETEKNKFVSEFGDLLKNMGKKNSSTDTLLQYATLSEFFKEIENACSKYSVSLDDVVNNMSNLQPKNNTDIAHRGYTPGGIFDNSAEGFRLAGEKGFWGCEADIRFDANGNLVCSHNAVKNGQNPTTFEEYLDICKEYGMTAIIDLKYEKGVGPADPNLSPAVLKLIQEKGMMNSCVLQTNNPTDIPYIRQTSSNARIWYLTDVISDKNIELIQENKVECVNILSSQNNAYRIKKLSENGIDVCVWNVNSEVSKNSLQKIGAKYIMSDNVLGITPYKEGDENLNDLKFNANEKILPTLLGTNVEIAVNNKTTSEESTTLSSGVRLTAPMGHIDGPEAYETWYDLEMSTVVKNMEKYYGYTNVTSRIRNDGVKVISGTAPDGTTFKDLVMVAADVRHISNPNGTYERGQIVDTTLGKGMVVDACGEAISKRKNNKGNHFDLATAWWTEPYASQAYSEDNNVQLRESVNNVVNGDIDSSTNLSKPSTSNDSSTSGSSSGASKPSTSSGSSTSDSSSGASKPSTSSGSSTSDSSSGASKPSASNGSSTSGSSSDLNSSISNILPSNKFSNSLPELASGNLGSMEISQNSVNYEVYNVNDYIYSDYVKSLIDQGYTMTDYGTFIKGNYQVVTKITKDGNMSISLNIL